MIKKLLITLLITLFLFFILEAYSFILTKKDNEIFMTQVQKGCNEQIDFKTEYKLFKPFVTTVYRPSTINETSNKKPIIWFGCSFAEGAGLEDEEIPCNKISKLTNRSCINKAKGATGTQFMYYLLKQNNFKQENPEADFIIYTFTWNHLQRIHNYQVNPLIYMHNLRYVIKNDKLKEINPKFNPFYSSYLVRRILNWKVFKDGVNESHNYRLFNKIILESYNLSKTYYPNAKFILLEFPEANDFQNNFISDTEIKLLESYGITVVKVTDLIPKNINFKESKYWIKDGIHPNAQLWDIVLSNLNEQYLN